AKSCGSIERLQQGDHSIFKMSDKFILEFGQFPLTDGETIEFIHKILRDDDEIDQNNLTVANDAIQLFNFFNNFTQNGQDLVTIRFGLSLTKEFQDKLTTYQQQPQNFLKHRNRMLDITPRKPKRVRDSTYHKEKMLLCKQAEKGYMAQRFNEVPNATQALTMSHWEQVHYDTDHNVFANDLQHFEQSESISNTCAVETGDSNVIPDSPDMCDNDIQNDQHDVELSLRRYKAFNDRTVDYDKLERKLNETLGLLAQKDIDIQEGLKVKAYEISVVQAKHDELVKQSLLTRSHYEGLVKEKTKDDSLAFIHDLKKEMHADLKYVESLEDELDELESDKAEFSNMYDMLLQECVSKDVMCSYLLTSSDLDEITELQCLYLHKVMECDCLAQKLSATNDFVR
ncbi:hypothetical protein Tco_0267121, partial [Tanacetum coccineum]